MRRNSGWQVYDDAGAKGEGEIGVGAVRAPVTSGRSIDLRTM